uniref:Uncharacterized protein n=1 Tax=Conchiformibius kuhniae TaxID=211502 RepID=A0A8T9MX52_9NEIS|nr:hypothetical protein LVJ77_11690 [Conchiformibius kuhniae]
MNTPMTRRHRLLRLPLAFCLMCAAACAATTAPSAAALHGDWVLLTVDGTPADTAHARLSFDDQAHFTVPPPAATGFSAATAPATDG